MDFIFLLTLRAISEQKHIQRVQTINCRMQRQRRNCGNYAGAGRNKYCTISWRALFACFPHLVKKWYRDSSKLLSNGRTAANGTDSDTWHSRLPLFMFSFLLWSIDNKRKKKKKSKTIEFAYVVNWRREITRFSLSKQATQTTFVRPHWNYFKFRCAM